jgi:ankyrin repeat protein
MIDFEALIIQLESHTCTDRLSLSAEDKPDKDILPRFLSALSLNTSLSSLHIKGWENDMTTDCVKAIQQLLQHDIFLRELHLDHNQLQDDSVTLLCAGLQQHPALHTVSLNKNRITAAGAMALADALPSLKKLQLIALGGNLLEDEGLACLLAALSPRQQPELISLSLSHNCLTAQAGGLIAEWLKQTGGLKKLFLSANSLGDAGVKAIAQVLPQARHLEWLVLNETGFGDVGIYALIQAFKQSPILKRCEVIGNPGISEQSLDHLLKSHRSVVFYSLLPWYLARGIERYDNGYYANAVDTLNKVLELKPGHQEASLYLARAKLAALQQRLNHYSALIKDNPSTQQDIVRTTAKEIMPTLRSLEQDFQQNWQEALPAEKTLLRQQGLALQQLALHLADLLNDSTLSTWYQAIQHQNKQQLDLLITQGYNINATSPQSGQSALHLVAKEGDVTQIKWLLDCGALATVKDKQGNFPVDDVAANNETALQILRKAYLTQMRQAERKWPQLLIHLAQGDPLTNTEMVRLDRRLEELPQDIHRFNQVYQRAYEMNPEKQPRLERLYTLYCDAYEPLFYLCKLPACYAHTESDLQAKEDAMISEITQLLETQKQGQIKPAENSLLGFYNEIAKLLADVRLLKGLSVVAYTAAQQRAETQKLWSLENLSLPYTIEQQTCQATVQGDLDRLKTLFASYPRLKYWRDAQQGTLLHLAAREGRLACLQFLIQQTVAIDSQNAQGLTPLVLAITSPQGDPLGIAELLKVANGNFLDGQGHTLVHLLLLSPQPQKVAVLHQLNQAGLSLSATTAQGDTPLHLAVRLGLTDVIIALLSLEVNLDHQNHAGQTPLTVAATKGNAVAILLLQQVVHQKQLAELKEELSLLKNTHSSDASRQQRLSKYELLLSDYESRQAAIRAEQMIIEQKQIVLNHPLVNLFYRHVMRKLTELFGAAKITHSGWVANSRKGKAGHSADVIDIVGQALPLPHVDKIIQLLTLGLRAYDQYQSGKANAQVAELFDSFQAIDRLAEDLAWALAKRYPTQIAQLTESSAVILAECAVGRIIAFLEKQPLESTLPLTEQLLDAIARNPIKQGRFACINQKMATPKGNALKWTDAGIFQRSGVLLPDGRCFVDVCNEKAKTQMRPEKYGFRNSSEEEVSRFKLQLHSTATSFTSKKGSLLGGIFQPFGLTKSNNNLPSEDVTLLAEKPQLL